MRKILMLLTAFLLAGCVEDSATFNFDGQEHSLTVRRQQRHFWQDEVDVSLVAARLPECQRLHPLASFGPANGVKVDLYTVDEQVWNVRLGKQLWQIETETCNSLIELEFDPAADLGKLTGSFVVRNEKLVFEPVPEPAAAPAAAPPAP